MGSRSRGAEEGVATRLLLVADDLEEALRLLGSHADRLGAPLSGGLGLGLRALLFRRAAIELSLGLLALAGVRFGVVSLLLAIALLPLLLLLLLLLLLVLLTGLLLLLPVLLLLLLLLPFLLLLGRAFLILLLALVLVRLV